VPPTFHDVIKSKYLLLTTFTKDGRPKPTAIWGVPEGTNRRESRRLHRACVPGTARRKGSG